MNQDRYKLGTGTKVAIIGGGPAGCFFAMYLIHYARIRNIQPDITIYENRDFRRHGPKGCKGCAGILSMTLLRNLAELELTVPEEIIQRKIMGYTVQSSHTSITIRNPESDKQVITVFRGCGPRIGDSQRPISFDGWLLSQTVKRGAKVEYQTVSAVSADKRMLIEVAGEEREYDLVVLASGVNAKSVALKGLPYIPPKTQTMAQDELQFEASGGDTFGDMAHAFLTKTPGLIAGCFVPKGSFINVSVLNRTERPISVSDFLGEEIVRGALPEKYQRLCGCWPKVAVSSARNYYADGFVAVGDAAASRLYKDGIGSALRTAREAARTAVDYGFSHKEFKKHYRPFCREIDRDNRWGKWLFWMNDQVKGSRTFLWAQHRLIGNEQTAVRAPKPFTRAVWGMFTGSYSYRSIARMTLSPVSLMRLGIALLREGVRSPVQKHTGRRKLHIGARKVLILGSGFAGTYLLRNLVPALNRNENVETIMVSDENFFLFSPLLHEVAMGRIETRHIAYPIRRLHWRDRFRFVQGTVEKIDLKGRTVSTTAGPLDFDYLVLALGSIADLSELETAEKAYTLKSLHDSMRIRNHIIEVFEQALVEKDPERREQLLTFVVSGGGYKGVQLITELRDFIHGTMLKLYRPIKPQSVRLILVEAEHKMAAELHTRVGSYILKQLQRMGIEVRWDSRITQAGESFVEINGAEIVPTNTLLWVAGVIANPRIAELDVEKDDIGRILVNEFLNVPGFPGVYAAGDCAHFKDPISGQPIPPRAHTAVRQAKAVAHNILAEIRGLEGKPYEYRHTPQMVSLGSSRAIVKFRKLRLYGLPGRLVWLGAYALLIAGNYNRIRVLMDWLLSFIFGRDTTFLRLNE